MSSCGGRDTAAPSVRVGSFSSGSSSSSQPGRAHGRRVPKHFSSAPGTRRRIARLLSATGLGLSVSAQQNGWGASKYYLVTTLHEDRA